MRAFYNFCFAFAARTSTPQHVSIGGGTSPQWSDGSREIVYVAPDQRLMAAAFDGSETGAVVSTPRALFRIENLAEEDRSLFFATRNDYVAASNGQRFLAAIRARDPNAPPITIVVNWLALLNRSASSPDTGQGLAR
jgi:hypothetical protein